MLPLPFFTPENKSKIECIFQVFIFTTFRYFEKALHLIQRDFDMLLLLTGALSFLGHGSISVSDENDSLTPRP